MKNHIETDLVGSKKAPVPHISKISLSLRVSFVLIAIGSVIAVCTYILYGFTQSLLKERLRERLQAIVATAALQFSPEEINAVRGIEDVGSEAFRNIVGQLWDIRETNSDIRFAYIMRRTEDPNILEFVADAESLLPFEEADVNGNGVIDPDEELPMPGDPYDATDYPVLRDEAFYYPIAERDLYEDQWGLLMAAYAPITGNGGDTIAIIGIDVLVNDFRTITQETLLPFVLFIAFLFLIIALLTLILMRTYRERIEAMREIDRQKDELLSIVSHQLATPVSSAKWYLEMLQDGDVGKLTPKQGEHVHSIQGIAENLTDLVSMILDVSRVQLGRMQVDREALDLSEFFKEILTVIEPKAEEKKVKFSVSLPEKLPVAMLDRRLMRMTLENLLSNAVKYTPEKGSVELRVTVKDDVLEYIVKDTGCGIPKAEQKKMFTKLFRASNVLNVSGNGFGLFVAKGAVEAQGGSISFVSAGGEGTTFTVAIPLITPKEGQK